MVRAGALSRRRRLIEDGQAPLQEADGIPRSLCFRDVGNPLRQAPDGAGEVHAVDGAGGDRGPVDGSARRRGHEAAGLIGIRRVRAVGVVVERAFELVEGFFLRPGGKSEPAFRDLADLCLGQVAGRFGQNVLQSAVGSGQLIDEGLAVEGGVRAALGARRDLFRRHGGVSRRRRACGGTAGQARPGGHIE